MVVETAGAVAAHDREKLDSFLAALKASRSEGDHSSPALLAGVVAGSPAHAAALWRLRESISESLVKAGPVYKVRKARRSFHKFFTIFFVSVRLVAAHLAHVLAG